MPTPTLRRLLASLTCLATLAACGGHASKAPGAAPEIAQLPAPRQASLVVGGNGPVPGPETPVAGAITSVVLQNVGTTDQAGAALTFGQVFADHDLQPGEYLTGKLSDGTSVPLQLDIKARHQDGAVRHAIISLLAPAVAPGQRLSMYLVKTAPPAAVAAVTPDDLLARGFTARQQLTLNGQVLTASADELLRAGQYRTWLSGPLANEWQVAAPLRTAAGAPHPHLMARFAIRATPGHNRARVDVTVENNWAYEAAPQNFTYDVQLSVGAVVVYSKPALPHYHHARWRKVLWWGAAPAVHIRHNTQYLIASRALPNYDTRVVVSEASLAALATQFSGARSEPMAVGMATPYMPATGGRSDIGLLPGWAATYLLSMDKRAKDAMLGTADLAGSWSSHFRDRNTDRPVSLHDYPYMTLLGRDGDTFNPATRKFEAFPACATSSGCATPNVHDASHQPGFAYLPYLVTGDFYYLEELQFWAVWNSFMGNPGYREYGRGLVKPDQVRGQAWSLRTLGQAAYITPDNDPLKSQLTHVVKSNLAWYNANYTDNPGATRLGMLTHGYAVVYDGGTGVAPWMDDFFTSAVGHLAELDFYGARELLEWKVKFPIARMTAAGTCWITGAIYALKVRDSATSPIYASMGQAWQASHTPEFAQLPCGGTAMAASLRLKVGEMTGYSALPSGYPSNMQPALAYAADVGGAAGRAAWQTMEQRSVKPDYGTGPQFAIVPRF